jgi:hypothetical protein
MDLKTRQERIDDDQHNGNIKVEHGFLHIYRSKSELTRYNKLSASEQVILRYILSV